MTASKSSSWATIVGSSGPAKVVRHAGPLPTSSIDHNATDRRVNAKPNTAFQTPKSDDQKGAPRILSIRLEASTLASLTSIRKRHFPARASQLDAHVTLFHAVPASSHLRLISTLEQVVRDLNLEFQVGKLRTNKRGDIVMLPLRCSDLRPVVSSLQSELTDVLSDQDLQPFRDAHVTLCNKRSAEETQERYPEIQEALSEAGITEGKLISASAVDLWKYRGRAPWEHVQTFPLNARMKRVDGS